MVYNVIGLMSGSSLDGLDICFAQYEEQSGKWKAQIAAADCIGYDAEWQKSLKEASKLDALSLLKLHAAYGRWIGTQVNLFIEKNNLQHKVHFIASHGHTVFHEPKAHLSFQLGDGANIAAVCTLPVISDLRNIDVALEGQGAPIVPIGDKLLFPDHDIWLNIGGIANLSMMDNNEQWKAFDICVANQGLNYFAQQLGMNYDKDGHLAATGQCRQELLAIMNQHPYLSLAAPKSLSNTEAMRMIQPLQEADTVSTQDKLATLCHFIAQQIKQAIQAQSPSRDTKDLKLFVSGGGALNSFLMQTLQSYLNNRFELPDATIIQYKEALVMGLIGVLRWREEVNVLAQTSGASRDSIGGALWVV